MEHSNPSQSFKELYTEKNQIGRGNFGSAILVTPKSEPNTLYVAKKIQLGNLSEKEQKNALLEARLLKDLNHPHIVDYIDSFIEDGYLIIVMEYCEAGDLTHHIKKMKGKGHKFQEDLILNWFLQMVFALNFIHDRRILHRDIKTSNIFLTSNNTVKLGDFGISKVLEGTLEKAETVVGTPYYMSPEVCANTPYGFKSDVWALGCVLYELCTLQHAFRANSLLSLVYQIVQEKQDPIPQNYSRDLQGLLNSLLTKKYENRPTADQILHLDFMKKVARRFVKNKDGIQKVNSIKETPLHREIQQVQEEFEGMTPAQIRRKRKQMKADQRRMELEKATRESYRDRTNTKQKKMANMMSSMDRHARPGQDQSQSRYGQSYQRQQAPAQQDYYSTQRRINQQQQQYDNYGRQTDQQNNQGLSGMGGGGGGQYDGFNDYPTTTIASMNMQTRDLNELKSSNNKSPGKMRKSNIDLIRAGERAMMGDTINTLEFSGPLQPNLGSMRHSAAPGEHTIMGDTIDSVQFGQTGIQRPSGNTTAFDTIKTDIMYNGTQQFHYDNEFGAEGYPDDFEELEEYNSDGEDELNQTRLTKKEGKKELNQVLQNYEEYILNDSGKLLKGPPEEAFQKVDKLSTIDEQSVEVSGANSIQNNDQRGILNTLEDKKSNMKNKCVSILGEDNFNEIYKYLSHHRMKGTEEKKIQKHLKEKYPKTVYSQCLQVDQLIFFEEMNKETAEDKGKKEKKKKSRKSRSSKSDAQSVRSSKTSKTRKSKKNKRDKDSSSTKKKKKKSGSKIDEVSEE